MFTYCRSTSLTLFLVCYKKINTLRTKSSLTLAAFLWLTYYLETHFANEKIVESFWLWISLSGAQNQFVAQLIFKSTKRGAYLGRTIAAYTNTGALKVRVQSSIKFFKTNLHRFIINNLSLQLSSVSPRLLYFFLH